jgi:hypothetical protein
MRVYVATNFARATLARAVMTTLEQDGHVITHDWTGENAAGKSGDELARYLQRCAIQDFSGVRRCQVLVVLNHPQGRGMFVEVGIALALGKIVLVVGPSMAECIFYAMAQCIHVETVADIAGALAALE